MPRRRFTIGRLMIAVALAGLAVGSIVHFLRIRSTDEEIVDMARRFRDGKSTPASYGRYKTHFVQVEPGLVRVFLYKKRDLINYACMDVHCDEGFGESVRFGNVSRPRINGE